MKTTRAFWNSEALLPKENIVQDENNDRKEVYATIAAKQGVTVEVVGKRRAEQIASKAAPGELIQKPKRYLE